MRCEAPFEPLLLNEGNGAAENRGVVAGQVNALSTLHTDERRSLRDAQQRLILLRAARCTQHTGSLKTAEVTTIRNSTVALLPAIAQYAGRSAQ